jgi:ribonuclease D
MASNIFHLSPPRFITSQIDFNTAVKDFISAKHLAVDTEANSLYAYQEQVCLIQISTKQGDYIIDVLAVDDLAPLGDLFQDPAIEKIFHASEYDILIMHDEFQFEFQNLFDTMLAAQILGREKLGLDALLEDYVGIQVNKKYQRANWGKRPLPDDMLKYAQVDTHFLYDIRNILAKELKAKNLTLMAEEDFQRACLVYRQVREDRLAPFWRVQGAKNLSPQQAAVLRKLYNYREQAARKINQPVFKVLGAQSLLHLAELCPTNAHQLLKLELPGKNALRRHADGLVQSIREGLKAPPEYPPKRERVDESFLAREKALRDWRKITARKMDVNSAVILPRELLYNLVSVNPSTAEEVAEVLAEVPWRLERFGDDILSVLKKAA